MDDPLPLHLLSTALYCQRKLYIEEVLSLKAPQGYADVKRDILQEALRYTNRAEPGIVKNIKEPARHDEIEDKYYDSARRSLQEAILNHREALHEQDASIIETHKQVWTEIKPYIKARIRNTHTFATTNHVYGNDLWWDLMPKITYGLNISSRKLGISMTIDRVDNYPHIAIPWLYKRQLPPEQGIWHNNRHELVAAMLALAEQGLITQEAVLAYEDGKQPRTLEMEPELEEQLRTALERTRAILDKGELPARVENTRKCERCPHKERCYDDVYMQARQQEAIGKLTF